MDHHAWSHACHDVGEGGPVVQVHAVDHDRQTGQPVRPGARADEGVHLVTSPGECGARGRSDEAGGTAHQGRHAAPSLVTTAPGCPHL